MLKLLILGHKIDPQGSLVLQRHIQGKHEKTFLSVTARARALIFGLQKVFLCVGERVGLCYALRDYTTEDTS